MLLPCRRRQLDSLQLADDFQNAVAPAQLSLGSHVLPSKKEFYEIRPRARFVSLPTRPQGQAVNPGQEHSVTPFNFLSPRSGKLSTQDNAVGFQSQQCGFDL